MNRRAPSAGQSSTPTADATNPRSQSSAMSLACSAEHIGKAHAHPVRHDPALAWNANGPRRGIARRANALRVRQPRRRDDAPSGLSRRENARHFRKRTTQVAEATSSRPRVQAGLRGVESRLCQTGGCLVSKTSGSIGHVPEPVKLDLRLLELVEVLAGLLLHLRHAALAAHEHVAIRYMHLDPHAHFAQQITRNGTDPLSDCRRAVCW